LRREKPAEKITGIISVVGVAVATVVGRSFMDEGHKAEDEAKSRGMAENMVAEGTVISNEGAGNSERRAS